MSTVNCAFIHRIFDAIEIITRNITQPTMKITFEKWYRLEMTQMTHLGTFVAAAFCLKSAENV